MLASPVDKEKGKAQFDADRHELRVTLPTIKKSIIDELLGYEAGGSGL